MPNPNIHLIRFTYINITYITNILLGHSQHLRAEERYAADTTSIASVPIAIGPESTATFPDSPFSDTSEETFPSDITSEKPPELTFPYDLPTDVPTLFLHSEPNNYLYPSVEPSSLPYPFPSNISSGKHKSVQDSPSSEPSIFHLISHHSSLP